ncbi:methyltransferase, UbiE/COQ5 family [gamma proteobacterium NOR5-3]|nr:methyltransferase, UbiE/COQ5 family [gamma proteobacterium NOR5-3]
MKQREKIVPRATGTVLEIGIGTGLNLPYYDSDKVNKLIGLDPSESSWELARSRAQDIGFPIEFIGLPSEQIPLADSSVDTIVMTFSLCTIPDPVAALEGMARVLRPGGSLHFAEHGQAPDEDVRRWQDRLDRPWGAIAGGCHLNRDIPALLEAGGFHCDDQESMYLPGTPRFAGFNVWGTARPA